MSINLVGRRADIARQIADDPWTITVRRRGRTPDDDDIVISFTGRITPAGGRGIPTLGVNSALKGERPGGTGVWLLTAPWDTGIMQSRDIVDATQTATSLAHTYRAVLASRFDHKWEVLLDELQ